MMQTKVVFKHKKRLNDSDRSFILNFLNRYFKETKEIVDIYIEEKSCASEDS